MLKLKTHSGFHDLFLNLIWLNFIQAKHLSSAEVGASNDAGGAKPYRVLFWWGELLFAPGNMLSSLNK
jgi:hypothetical protein